MFFTCIFTMIKKKNLRVRGTSELKSVIHGLADGLSLSRWGRKLQFPPSTAHSILSESLKPHNNEMTISHWLQVRVFLLVEV